MRLVPPDEGFKYKWDAFKSYPRAIYTAHLQDSSRSSYFLQCLRLALYIVSCVLLLIGSVFSRSVVLILSTNISNITETEIGALTKCKATAKDFGIEIGDYAEKRNDVIAAIILSLWFIQTIPDFVEAFRSFSSYFISKDEALPIVKSFILLETLRSAASLVIVLFLFPKLDLFRCIFLISSFVFAPIFLKIFKLLKKSIFEDIGVGEKILWLMVSVPLSYICCSFFSMFYIWDFIGYKIYDDVSFLLWIPTLGLCFWESWIFKENSSGIFDSLFKIKYGLKKVSAKTRLITAICRICASCIVFSKAVKYHKINDILVSEFLLGLEFSTQAMSIFWLSGFVVIVNASLRFSIRLLSAMKMQITTLWHPYVLLPIVSFWVIYIAQYEESKCFFDTLLSDSGLAIRGDRYTTNESGLIAYDFYIGVLWYICHILWAFTFIEKKKTTKRHEYIEAVAPNSNGLFIDQSLLVFSHRIKKKGVSNYLDDGNLIDDALLGDYHIKDGERIDDVVNNTYYDNVPTIYACATMWHETRNEMKQLLESLMKLDEERKKLEDGRSGVNSFFNLEAHIFFDDAWMDDELCGRIPNEYFDTLYNLLRELLHWDEPQKAEENEDDDNSNQGTIEVIRILLSTPYGGRFVTKFKNGTVLYVHLKDKLKIRHKKRWSQVMYMYYLLGHRIMDSDISTQDRKMVADNTYILAMDGDSKFKPEAVLRLLNLMRMKNDIGCACGRIHPIGTGIMVWYQKFEYAIAHWFQKAAEHVFGCVLCAPGCFSLFRASALMDDNIMHKYTKVASEARQFVQYDQGEDRWLSTLLLKKGYRIEYVASSDAETYAPEGFEEFFNQRRRWTPSSVANTIDLLMDYKVAVTNNSSISKLYILYQAIVIGFSMFGPAIIFTMIVFAQTAAFGISSDKMIWYNALPIITFIGCCFLYESSVQLKFAKTISIIYAFVMLSVMVATTSQIVLETIFSPTSMFVVNMVVIFLFAAFIHPHEFTNIIYGSVFFLMIPATYIFMALYSLINLNVINWGTREAVAKATGHEAPKEDPILKLFKKFSKKIGLNVVGQYLLQCLTKNNEEFKDIKMSIERLENKLEGQKDDVKVEEEKSIEDEIIKDEEEKEHIIYKDYTWMDTEALCECKKGELGEAEDSFWHELIDNYLAPLRTTKEENLDAARCLIDLRNKVSFTILILNALLVLAIYLLQKHKNVLSFDFQPFNGFEWTKMNEMTGQFEATTDALKIDPLGLVIIIFLMGILIVQTIGMVIHRFNTLIESLSEIADVENEFLFSSSNNIDHDEVIDIAQSMLNTVDYETAHGVAGYRRPETRVKN
uniref:chitin synthase n=1 Tax=Parastrongyloides trichosuri TaxID=131310 RepID=A0A0N4Z1S4_PARTI